MDEEQQEEEQEVQVTVIERIVVTLGLDDEGNEIVFSESSSDKINYITASGMLHAAQRQLDAAQEEQS